MEQVDLLKGDRLCEFSQPLQLELKPVLARELVLHGPRLKNLRRTFPTHFA